MRRSVGEGMQNRYVTGDRLERVLKVSKRCHSGVYSIDAF